MTPTLALPPPRIGQAKTPPWAQALLRAGAPPGLLRLITLAPSTLAQITFEPLRGVPFTQLANVTGVPAMSVPLAQLPSGLPAGVQFMADHGEECRLCPGRAAGARVPLAGAEGSARRLKRPLRRVAAQSLPALHNGPRAGC